MSLRLSQLLEYRLIINCGRAKTSGNHTVGPSQDQTDKGLIWDVTKNFRGFWYNPSSGAISIAPGAGSGGLVQPSEGTSWLNFSGFWGDKKPPIEKPGQRCILDQCLISDGPSGEHVARIDGVRKFTNTHTFHTIGPLSKNLGRIVPCQDESSCTVQISL